jgi:uncharacterized protein (TIGR03437 family)
MAGKFAAGFCVLAACLLLQGQTGTPPTCTDASLSGTHSLILSGRDLNGTTFSQIGISLGTATFDGAGNVTFNLTVNTALAQGTAQTLSGTYNLPPNCLGTLNITSGDTASFTLIPYNSGNAFTITGQDATYQFTGGGSLPPAACLTSTLSGAYVFSGNGFAIGSGAIAGVNSISGVLQFDGAGAVTGSWAISTNGMSTPDTFTGNYSMSSMCVGNGTVTTASGATYNLNFTVTTAAGADFGVLGGSPGNLFTATAHSTFTNPGLAVANAAGVSGGTPAGSLFSIYGTGLATAQAQPSTLPLPTKLANATVTVNGQLVPLTYVNKDQINAQLPLDIQPGVATLVVTNGTAVSNSVAITVPSTAVPGVFIYGNNHAVAQNYPDYSLNSESNPIEAGGLAIVYFTGGGPVQGGSALVTGHATPNSLFPVIENASATIANVNATLDYVGLTPGYVGLYQANVVIPSVAAGDHTLVITIGGVASKGTVISTK